MNDRTEPKDKAELFTDKYSTLYNLVPSDKEELFSIKKKIKEELLLYKDSEHIITVYEVRKAISKLCEDKSDGDGELWSNHVIYAPESLSIHISMLLTGVITHSYNPIYLLTGTLVSLTKDTRGNICDSDNYRGICVCSCIIKVLEWCIMLRYSDKLGTSGLQFSFKSGHSTTMCSLVTKEVVTYYWNRHS